MRYIALDFETSGLDPQRHAPVTLGVALFDGGEVFSREEWIMAPPTHYKTGRVTREYDLCALEISGYSWKSIKDGMSPVMLLGALRAWAERDGRKRLPIVAFNASFDLAFYSTLLFLAGEYDRHAGAFRPATPPLVGPWHCARMLAQDRLPDLPDHKLDTVAGHFGLSRTGEKHSAIEDAILAGRVFDAIRAATEAVRA